MATATTITERKPRPFEPRSISFPASVKEEIDKWLCRNIESRISRLRNLHENQVPEWRRIVDGEPKEKNKSWPFPNCSNLVHQLAGEACDDLAARVLQLIWNTHPLFYFKYLVKAQSDEEAAKFSRKQELLQDFIDYVGNDPRELDLYTHENKWFIDSAGLGKAHLMVSPEHRMEAVYVGFDNGKTEFDERTLYEGPRLVNLRYEDVLADPDCQVFENNDPLIVRHTLNKRQLQERAHKGFFKSDKVTKILGNPDRYGPTAVKRRENAKKGIADTEDTTLAEWDVYACYFSWYHSGIKFRLIAWVHQRSKSTLNCVYNFIPDNQIPIVETNLSVDGKGFAKMLKHNQEEVSTSKNQRNDAMTWGILGINTLNPQNKNIDRNMKIWPGIMLPVSKDDFMHHEVANPAMQAMSLQNEMAMIQQAQNRAGIAPAVSGSGAGTVDKKGKYSSMGTMAVMQDSNTRSAHRQSDFRHSHVKLGGLVTDFYGFLGLGRKGTIFGIDEKLLTEVLDDVLERKLRIPMRAATASVNIEVTKQNVILLNQSIEAFVKSLSQQIQAVNSPTAPPEYRKWLVRVINTRVMFMRKIVKDFQLSDHPEEFIPDAPKIQIEDPNAKAQQPQGGPEGELAMAEAIRQRGLGGGDAGIGGLPGAPGGLQG
jgi:hypothetical protein